MLTDPNAAPPPGLPRPAGGRSPIEVVVPAHLQDLKEGDLPEDQRVVVLDQIAIFRENAARRERDKKKIDEEKERFKAKEAAASASRGQPSTAGYGYGNRALTKDHPHTQTPQRQWGQPQSSPQENGSGSKDRRGHDPQGYDKPVPFVKAQQAEGKGESERTDEEEEESRRQRRNRERDHALREVSEYRTKGIADVPSARDEWRIGKDSGSIMLTEKCRIVDNRKNTRRKLEDVKWRLWRIGMMMKRRIEVGIGSIQTGGSKSTLLKVSVLTVF